MGNRFSKKKPKKKNPIKPRKHLFIIGSQNVGKTTILNSIALDPSKEYGNLFLISSIRTNCCWYLINLLLKCQILTTKTESVEQIENLCINKDIVTNNWYQDVKFALEICCEQWIHEDFRKLNDHIMHRYKDAILKLWSLSLVQDAFKQRYDKELFVIDNMEYWFNTSKLKILFSGTYDLTKEDVLRAPYDHRYEHKIIKFKKRNIISKRNIIMLRFKVTDGAYNNPSIRCVLFVCGLNQYREMQKGGNGLLLNIKYFADCVGRGCGRENKMVVLLNKVDIFKEYLMGHSLRYCFGDEYKGRDYMRESWEMMSLIYYKIFEHLIRDGEFKVEEVVPLDVCRLICSYFIIRYERWLDVVCQDGIEFIKKKFMEIKPDINVYIINPFDETHMKQFVDKIYSL